LQQNVQSAIFIRVSYVILAGRYNDADYDNEYFQKVGHGTMKNKAIPFLMTGIIVLTLFNVVNLAAELPHWAIICAIILGTLSVVCGVFIVVRSKKKK